MDSNMWKKNTALNSSNGESFLGNRNRIKINFLKNDTKNKNQFGFNLVSDNLKIILQSFLHQSIQLQSASGQMSSLQRR